MASAEEPDDSGVASACFTWVLLAPRTALKASLLEVLAATSGRLTPREESSGLLAILPLRRTTMEWRPGLQCLRKVPRSRRKARNAYTYAVHDYTLQNGQSQHAHCDRTCI